MASVITALQPVLYSAAQEVSAEPFGVVSAINSSFDDKGVAKGDTVYVPYAPVQANTAFAPANVAPEGTSVTAASIPITITKSQMNSMVLTGEQIRSLENGGNYQEWSRQWAAQAMRALRNECEADAALAVKYGASRAIGTAGTTPFATSLDLLVDARKILADNGAPMADLQLVMNTAAGANARKLAIIQQADQAGTDGERRTGQILRQYGFMLRESAGIVQHVKGTATGIDVNNGAGYTKGATVIASNGSDSGTLLNGDCVTWVGDTNIYVVGPDNTITGAAAGNVILNRPGLRGTLADAVEMTIGDSYTPTLAFERSSTVGVIRPPLVPANPTIQQSLVSDGKGMTYLFLDVTQFGQRSWFMCLAWGFKVVQSEHVALILG